MDGTTDKGNIDDEIFLTLWCDVESTHERVHRTMLYFGLSRPKEVNAQGLLGCLQTSLQSIGISTLNADECKRLVGIGTDGASVNIAAGGLKCQVEKELPWVFWMCT